MAKSKVARITLNAVAKLELQETIRDTEVKGFGVRRRNGQPSYFLQTRVNGRLRWITIGTHGSPWTPVSARKEALKLLQDVASGEDPNHTKKTKRGIPTFREASELFLEEHGAKISPRTFEEYKRMIEKTIIPTIGTRQVNDLDRADVARAHKLWGEKKKRNANHALAVLSKFISWLEEQGFRPDNTNPCRGIKKYPENRIERYLSSEEFVTLGEVLIEAEQTGEEDQYIIAAIRLLIFTGARLSEILTLKWEDVDLERGIIFLKQSKTGQKPVFLNEPARDILATLPKLAKNPYVIIGKKIGSHLINLQKPWRRIRAKAGLDDVRLHDLRHSFASLAAGSGASLPLIGGLLGHTQPQTTARYAHLAHNPLKEVNEVVGEKLKGMIFPSKANK